MRAACLHQIRWHYERETGVKEIDTQLVFNAQSLITGARGEKNEFWFFNPFSALSSLFWRVLLSSYGISHCMLSVYVTNQCTFGRQVPPPAVEWHCAENHAGHSTDPLQVSGNGQCMCVHVYVCMFICINLCACECVTEPECVRVWLCVIVYVVWECECVCMSMSVYQTLCVRWHIVKGERWKLGDWDVDAVHK